MDTIRLVIRRAAWLSILIVLLVTLVPIGWRPAIGAALGYAVASVSGLAAGPAGPTPEAT